VKRAFDDRPREACDVCRWDATRVSLRVLGLDRPRDGEPSGADRDWVPRSILGLASNYQHLQPMIIPAHAYRAAQGEPIYTASASTVLACRGETALVRDVVESLFEDEVRLRGAVKDVNIRSPIPSNEPSISIHPDAQEFYQNKGLLPRAPREESWFSLEYIR